MFQLTFCRSGINHIIAANDSLNAQIPGSQTRGTHTSAISNSGPGTTETAEGMACGTSCLMLMEDSLQPIYLRFLFFSDSAIIAILRL